MIGTILIAKPTIEANYRHLKMKEKNMEQYIASCKHLIGCEILDYDIGEILIFSIENTPVDMVINGMFPLDNFVKFYLDSETLGTYAEYMQLHYPEYVHIWSQQL